MPGIASPAIEYFVEQGNRGVSNLPDELVDSRRDELWKKGIR